MRNSLNLNVLTKVIHNKEHLVHEGGTFDEVLLDGPDSSKDLKHFTRHRVSLDIGRFFTCRNTPHVNADRVQHFTLFKPLWFFSWRHNRCLDGRNALGNLGEQFCRSFGADNGITNRFPLSLDAF